MNCLLSKKDAVSLKYYINCFSSDKVVSAAVHSEDPGKIMSPVSIPYR